MSGVPTHEVFPAGCAGVVGYRAVLVFNNDAVLRSRSVTRGIEEVLDDVQHLMRGFCEQ